MKRKAVNRTTVVLVTLGIVGLGLLKSVPYFIDKQALKQAIEEGLHESTGVNFHIRELRLDPTVFHGIQVQLNTSTITDMKHHPLGSIGNITVQIRYWPLLAQQLPEIAKVHLNHVLIPVGTSNFFKELHLKLTKPKRTGFLKPAEMRDTEILLSDYRIEDTVLSSQVRQMVPLAQSFSLHGDKLSLKHLESKKPISLLGDGVLSFLPDNVWLAKAPPQLTGKPVETSQAVHYKIMLEIPQAVTKQSTFNPGSLSRLELALKGGRQDLSLRYQRQPDKPGQMPLGKGVIQSPGLELVRSQVLAIQLGDTFGLPLPPGLLQTVVAGNMNLNTQFELAFPKPSQVILKTATGNVGFDKLAIAPFNQPKRPWLEDFTAKVSLNGQMVQANRLTFAVAGLPLSLKGLYRLDNQQINAQLTGNNLRVSSLKDKLAGYGVSAATLSGLNLQGAVDVNANLTGTLSQPVYQGVVALRNARFQDQQQGLEADHLTGHVRFQGAGLKKPIVQYQGNLNVADGHFVNAQQGIDVQHFDGKVAFHGRYQPGPSVPLPQYEGQIDIRQARYQDPKSGLLVSDIQGVIRLGENLIHLDQFKALFAGSTYTASGQLKQDLSAYNINLRGDRIDLPRLKQALAPQFPVMQASLSKLEPYSGQARLNLDISTGMNMQGRLDVSGLAVNTGQRGYPLQVPRMSVLFQNKTISLPTTAIYLGPVPVELSGQARQSGQYNFNIASGTVPMAVVRDNEPLLQSLSGLALPEIWNTDGSLMFQGQVANSATRFKMEFQNAGLSWEGGDFPVYDLNGGLTYQQSGRQMPVIASQNLNFRYGNSPVSVSLDNRQQLNAVTEGVLSALTVNHFLVSRQSNAAPYKAVPFQASARGVLAQMSGLERAERSSMAQKNDVKVYLHFNLDQNLRYAFDGSPTTSPTSASTATATPAGPAGSPEATGSKINILHPVRSVNHVLSAARQTVQAGLDSLIGSAKASENALPTFGQSSGEEGLSSESQASSGTKTEEPAPPAAFNPDDPGAAFLSARLHWLGPNVQLDQALLHLFDAGDLLANGRVENVADSAKRVFLMRLASEPGIDLAKLSQGASTNRFLKDAKGQVAMDVQVAGNGDGPKLASGWLNTAHVALPYLTLRDLTGRATLDGETAQAVVDNFEIPGLSTSATGRTANIFEMPVSLEDVKIHGRLLSIESLGQFNDQIVRPVLIDQVAHNFMRPWQQGDPTLPVQFRNADLKVDEVIYQNIILSNMASQFSLYANSFLELSNTSIQAAGGTAHGYLSMSPNDDGFTTLELNVDNVKANALTKALLNATNQIFGDVDGTVRFTTFGVTPDDMQKNANGTVSVRVINGRLPAIAKVETLLTTANIIRGGILGLNLNNLLRSLTIYDTNYFATLSGDMLINNQVLYTRNLSSYGVNLDLLIRGSVRMDNGNANLLVDGRMQQVVAGRLGALGTLSLGGLVRYIPALGTFGNNSKGLLGYIPGVGWVPGFGGPAGDINRFRVRLVGDLNNPGAIQDFHWVH